jgi:energy-coupling factor transport system substrate-specific component
MTWQLGAFAVLALGLAAGFAWYERARPDARLVALVGTLAAFAALGRVAFAAVPNVKPTTDIVLISGFALGGAPGFVVGALAGLTSNFFFGQGPWTPWQMAAWAMTGLLGAGLAVATSRRIGRWWLAVACGLAGFAFTAIQDVGDWFTYSDHSLAQLGIYVGKGIGFDVVHAVGCVAFALAFGPPLIRSIQRCARRLQVTWRPADANTMAGRAPIAGGGPIAGRGPIARGGAIAVIAMLLAAGLVAAPTVRATATPRSYLSAAQNGDGGLGAGAGEPSSPLYSGWAALAFAAAGQNPQAVRHGGGQSLIGYIGAGLASASEVGSLERTILVVRAAGLSAEAFQRHNLVARLLGRLRRDGSVSDQVNLTSFAILALRSAGHDIAPATRSWLLRQQDVDGGFNFAAAGGSSDVDDTGAALEALAAAGHTPARARARAVAFIRGRQNHDGGFPSQPGADSNAQSTAWAVQGLIAAGVAPRTLHRRGAPSPLNYLQSLIAADGHVRYSRASDQTPVWVTAQALMALAGKALPVAPVPLPAGSRPAPHRSHAEIGSHSGKAPAAVTGSAGPPRRAARRRAARVALADGHPPRRASGDAQMELTGWSSDLGLLSVPAALLGALGIARAG